jgi:FlaA1/EpsC-like NDP-sugar epimerase/lipopolysaccharide/colanic/teichoic acid biosynthesis glycosyltransferase
MKRLLDVVLSATGLLLLSPVLAAVAVAIKREGGGPVLFRQKRVGRDFRPFRILKFRTMVPGAERLGPGITPGSDPRVTRLGAFLRWTKLDELPQLWNVLRGDMSLVGPRPELPHYARLFEDDYREILRVRPGITDVASLVYRDEAGRLALEQDPERAYVDTILPEKIRLARIYVSRAGLGYDMKIIVETLLVLVWPARRLEQLFDRLGRVHRTTALLVQAALAVIANQAAMWLVFDGALTRPTFDVILLGLPVLVVLRTLCLWSFHLDLDRWRYVGLRELAALAVATGVGTAAFFVVTRLVPALSSYPRSVIVVDFVLCLLALAGARVLRRAQREFRDRTLNTRRTLVVGGGDAAERIVRDLQQDPHGRFEVVGLVGGDRGEAGLRVHAVPILGGVEQLDDLLRAIRPDEIVLVAAGVPAERLDAAVRSCRACGAAVRIVSEAGGERNGAESAPELEEPRAEDLLFRAPVEVDLGSVRGHYAGRAVLVTGAGGSIGSEICRQVAACGPARLVLFEKHEASLYHIERELRARHPGLVLHPVLGDVADGVRVAEIFARTTPDVVFHAAAYKHVPMLEINPGEGYKTNVEGTRTVCEAADRAGVGTFVLISTDKAVEPVSVLGATKRMAELAVQEVAGRSTSRCMTVRFGNVLESSGSVVPLFKEQIERGGPITVTHSEATRWFMTVPEAVQLILEAAAMGRGGEVFVLDMGKPVRIVDLAHALIRRYGLRPERDIKIEITGLRPGERLFEKLFNDHELVWKTRHPRILMAAEVSSRRGVGREDELDRLRRFVAFANENAAAGCDVLPAARGLEEEEGVCA